MGAAWWLTALAVSLDGVVVGAAYGARSILLPAGSLILVGSLSSLLALAGGLLGNLAPLAAARSARALGGVILVALGLAQFLRARGARSWPEPGGSAGAPEEAGDPRADGAEPLLLLRFRLLNLVVQVVLEPEAGDIDRSGRLEGGEAALVGLSLGLDAAAAGLAAALGEEARATLALGFPLAVGLFQTLALATGLKLGARSLPPPLAARLPYLPGMALLGLGLIRLLAAR